jgi:twitching motility protein PilT
VALRQAPKVILVGEIRDRETMEIAMTASETGHLVFSTLHTVNAGQTINRIVGFFRRDEEEQVRQRLSGTLRYVVNQRLVSKVDGGRLLVTEILGSNLRTREVIRYGESESKTFNDIIEASSPLGWHTFDQSLLRAREQDLVTDETVVTNCTNKSKTRQQLDLLQKRRGKQEAAVSSGLKLDIVAPIKAPPKSDQPARTTSGRV